MKNKVAASFILAAAILLLLLGNFPGNLNFSIGNIQFVKDRPTYKESDNDTSFIFNQNYIDVYEELDRIEQVELNLIYGDLKILNGDKVSIKGNNVNETCFSHTVNNTTLIVDEKKTNSIWNYNPSYVLTLPSNTPLLKLVVNGSSGTVKMDGISADEVTLHVEKGSLEGINLDVSKLNIDAGIGSVNLHKIISREITISSGMGSINMDCKIEGDNGNIKVDSQIGSVNLELDNDPADFYFDLAKRSSSVMIDGVKATDYKYYNNDVNTGKYSLEIGSGISSVELCFPSP